MKFKHFILVSVLALLQSNCAVEEEPIISSYSANYKEINGDVDAEDPNEIIEIIEIVDNVSDIKDVIVSTKLPRKGIYNTTKCALNNNQINSEYLNSVKSITAGDRHTCALLNSGDVACWGYETTRASCQTGLDEVSKIDSNGGYQLCALKNNGTVYCGYLHIDYFENDHPSKVKYLNDAIDIGNGDYGDHCAILNSGDVKCWGNRFDENAQEIKKSVFVNELKYAKKVKTNSGTTCIQKMNNEISCLYYDDGYKHDTTYVYDLDKLGVVDQFDYKLGSLLCAVRNKEVYCTTALIDSPSFKYSEVYKVKGLNNVQTVSVSSKLNCVLTHDKTVKCWEPQFIENSYLIKDEFNIETIDISNVIQVTTGGYNDGLYSHACALIDNGTVKCWGDNYNGQLGIGTSDNSTNIPTLVETN